MKKLAFFALLLVGSACSKENAAPAPPQVQTSAAATNPTNCPDVYDPVCSNGVTYANACYARKAGVTTYTRGACDGSGGPI